MLTTPQAAAMVSISLAGAGAGAGSGVGVGAGISELLKWNEERNIKCESLGITSNCGDNKIRCAEDCISIGKEYFRWNAGGFGSSSCTCKLNNETMKIW